MINTTRYAPRESRVNEFFTLSGKTPFETGTIDDSVLACIEEESDEFISAAYEYEEALEEGDLNLLREARANLVKEWADMQYVVSQAAIYFNIPADAAFNRVADNNMTKVQGGEIKRREDGKILKPDNYVPADMSGL